MEGTELFQCYKRKNSEKVQIKIRKEMDNDNKIKNHKHSTTSTVAEFLQILFIFSH